MNSSAEFVSVISGKALLADAVFGLVGAVVCAIMGKAAVTGFIAGFITGVANQYLYFAIAGKTAWLQPEKASLYVVSRFYMRFFLSMVALGALTWRFSLEIVPVLAGFSLTFLITITTVAITLKKEIEKPCTKQR